VLVDVTTSFTFQEGDRLSALMTKISGNVKKPISQIWLRNIE
jgi:hypothetical protein